MLVAHTALMLDENFDLVRKGAALKLVSFSLWQMFDDHGTHLASVKVAGIDLAALTPSTHGCSGADLEALGKLPSIRQL